MFFPHHHSPPAPSPREPRALGRCVGSTGVEESESPLNPIELPCPGAPSQLRSISTATERCRSVTDRMSFHPDLIFTTIPVKPVRGPYSIRAAWPIFTYGHGITD